MTEQKLYRCLSETTQTKLRRGPGAPPCAEDIHILTKAIRELAAKLDETRAELASLQYVERSLSDPK